MSITGVDEGKLRHAFLEEAEELVQKLSSSLLLLEADKDNHDLVNEIFRLVHSLKSESALLGYSVFSQLAHRMEDVLGLARSAELVLDKQLMDRVFAGADLLSEMLSVIAKGGSDAHFDTGSVMAGLSVGGNEPPRASDTSATAGSPASGLVGTEKGPLEFLAADLRQLEEARDRGETFYKLTVTIADDESMRLARIYLVYTNLELSSNVVKVVPPVNGEPVDDSLYVRTEFYLTTHEDEDRVKAAAEVDQIECVEIASIQYETFLIPTRGIAVPTVATPFQRFMDQGKKQSVEKTTIRVDTKKLDDLWSLIAELIQQKAHVSRIYERLSRGEEPFAVQEDLGETFDSLDKISGNMQQVMMQTRMIPISVIFNKFPRLVRDLSRKLGKSVELLVSGEETEIDRGIVEALSDPLTHIIRNSIDHGIESPEERVKLGKPEKGRVRISAYQQGRGIVIELEDDGRGIDLSKIREKAVPLGVPGIEEFDDEKLLELIFLPGLSTKDVVTDLSGRGVGMDVVATRIRGDLKGEVTVTTVPGEGTLLSILLPLTLTIIHALLVRAEGLVFALPLAGVDSTAKILNTEIRGEEGRRTCTWQREEIPLSYLGSIRGKGLPRAEEYVAVILSYGMDRACLVVDRLLEEQEIVVKPIDDLLNYRKLFTGITVLEDGTPVYILDTSLVQRGIL
jgi:two-component system chemotaxis sensor kinase CheA